jgi:hypothetical protein
LAGVFDGQSLSRISVLPYKLPISEWECETALKTHSTNAKLSIELLTCKLRKTPEQLLSFL